VVTRPAVCRPLLFALISPSKSSPSGYVAKSPLWNSYHVAETAYVRPTASGQQAIPCLLCLQDPFLFLPLAFHTPALRFGSLLCLSFTHSVCVYLRQLSQQRTQALRCGLHISYSLLFLLFFEYAPEATDPLYHPRIDGRARTCCHVVTTMMNKLMLTFLGVEFLFLCSGGLLLGFCLVSEQQERGVKNVSNVAYDILLFQCPLTGMVFICK
jgi:hypothetical protein